MCPPKHDAKESGYMSSPDPPLHNLLMTKVMLQELNCWYETFFQLWSFRVWTGIDFHFGGVYNRFFQLVLASWIKSMTWRKLPNGAWQSGYAPSCTLWWMAQQVCFWLIFKLKKSYFSILKMNQNKKNLIYLLQYSKTLSLYILFSLRPFAESEVVKKRIQPISGLQIQLHIES